MNHHVLHGTQEMTQGSVQAARDSTLGEAKTHAKAAMCSSAAKRHKATELGLDSSSNAMSTRELDLAGVAAVQSARMKKNYILEVLVIAGRNYGLVRVRGPQGDHRHSYLVQVQPTIRVGGCRRV